MPIPAGKQPGRCESEVRFGPLLSQAEVFFVRQPDRRISTRYGPHGPQVQGVRDRVPARRPLRVRIVLRPARGRVRRALDRKPRSSSAKIQAGPAGIWRYADFLPFADRPRDPLEPGLTPLVRADRLAERLGIGELWVKNDAANPTHSFKDRVVAVAVAKARELGFETVACASTGNLANAVAAHAAAAGLDSYVFVPVRPRGAEAARHGRLRHEARRRARQLRRRQPALHAALRGSAVGVRERQPAPVLRRRLEDPRLRDRSSSSAGGFPTGSSCRSRRARSSPSSDAASPNGSTLGLVAGELPAFNGAQATGCSPVATAYAEGWDVVQAAEAGHDRQEPRDRRPGGRPLRARARAEHRRRDRRRDGR